MSLGGHYWGYYVGSLSLSLGNSFEDWALVHEFFGCLMHSHDLKIGHQGRSPGENHQGDMPCLATLFNEQNKLPCKAALFAVVIRHIINLNHDRKISSIKMSAIAKWVILFRPRCFQERLQERNKTNSLRPRQNGRNFADNIFKGIFFNENVWILNKISLKYVPYGLIDNKAALVQIMAWRRRGDKPLSEAMLVWCTDT